jgi:hypothetical protein
MANASKFPFIRGLENANLTDRQKAFVRDLVRSGRTPTNAVRHAGYRSPKSSAYDLLRVAQIQSAIQFERTRYISDELANVATNTLREVMQDSAVSVAARVQAARTLLEISGDLKKAHAGAYESDKPLPDMTPEELASLIDKWPEERSALAASRRGASTMPY